MSLTYAEAEKLFELYTTCVVSASGRLLTTGPEPERIEL